MNHITRTYPVLSDLSIVVLFKVSDVFPESGPEVSDQQITPGSRPPLCDRKTGRNIVELPSYWGDLWGPSSIFLTLRARPSWYLGLWSNLSDYKWPAEVFIQVPSILTLIPCFFSGSEDWTCSLLCCRTRTHPASNFQRSARQTQTQISRLSPIASHSADMEGHMVRISLLLCIAATASGKPFPSFR